MATDLTRAQQDLILIGVIVTARSHSTCPHARVTVSELRGALRLDDKRLAHAIAYGAHKQPWQSAPDRDRVRA